MESPTRPRAVGSCEPAFPRVDAEKRRIYRAINAPLLSLIQTPPRRVLDLGCGDGSFAAALLGRFPDAQVVGITSSDEEHAEASSKMSSAILADVTSPILETLGTFDMIICSHILEHVAEPAELLVRVRKLLDGTLYAAIPNTLHWRERLKLLRGHVPYADGGPFDRTHLRFFDCYSAAELFRSAGYRIRERASVGNAPLPFIRTFTPAIAERLDKSIPAYFPGLFAEQFLFAVTK